MKEPTARTEQILKLGILALLILGCIRILLPFLTALLWAVVLCFCTWQLYARLLRAMGDRHTLAALTMTLAVTIVLLAPFVGIAISLTDDVQKAAESTRRVLEESPHEPPAWFARVPLVGTSAQKYWRDLANKNAERIAEVRKMIEPAKAWLLQASVAFGRGLVELAMSLIILFFLYRDGIHAAEHLKLAIQRIGGEQAQSLLDVAGATVRGVVYGIIGTALAQSVIAGIGLAIAGVPRAGFLALLTFFLSVVPAGPPLVWIPATIWLFYQGYVGWGIFMAIWGIVLISGVDNIVKPLIISRGSALPFLLIMMGVIGGAVAFGFIGVFIGPTLLAVAFRMMTAWTAAKRKSLELAVVQPAPVAAESAQPGPVQSTPAPATPVRPAP